MYIYIGSIKIKKAVVSVYLEISRTSGVRAQLQYAVLYSIKINHYEMT